MDWTTNVAVHESAYPAFVRERILKGLQEGHVDPGVLYSGLRQALNWAALHHAVSPAQLNPEFVAIYDQAFDAALAVIRGNVAHVVSLGCGDGTKDARCLTRLRESGRAAIYTAADISMEMVLTARQNVCADLRGLQCTPLVCELTRCSVLPAILKSFDPSGAERLILFFGTIHNYWPPEILKSILYPLRSQDHLLVSANLAPAGAYESALQKILSQYDNAPTREWLSGVLSELNLSPADGELRFALAPAPAKPELQRIEANFHFHSAREIQFFGTPVRFEAGQKLRVFYSWRFTREMIRGFLQEAGLSIEREWITTSEEEGVFLCRRSSPS